MIPSNFSRGSIEAVTVIIVLAAVAIALSWQPVERLHTDPSRWMYEASRMAGRDAPYRHFTWPYFPAGIYLVGLWARTFGDSILSFAAFAWTASIPIVGLMWHIIRKGGESMLRSGLIVAAGAALTSLTAHERLFSLNLMTPSGATGLIGCLVAVAGLQSYSQNRLPASLWVAAAGSALAALSKIDFALAAMSVGIVGIGFGSLDKPRWSVTTWGGQYLAPFAILFLLSMLLVSLHAGFGPLALGLSGFGVAQSEFELIAKLSWSRWLDLVVVPIYLALGVLVARKVLTTEPFDPGAAPQTLSSRLGSVTPWIISAGFVVVAALSIGSRGDFRMYARLIVGNAGWLAIAFVLSSFILLLKRRNRITITKEAWTALLLSALVGAAYIRTLLWGSMHYTAPLFAGACFISFVLFGVCAPHFRWNKVSCSLLGAAGLLVAVAALTYAADHPATTLHTAKGDIRVLARLATPAQETLTWIDRNTNKSARIVSAPYGAGLNYLANRESPMHQTLFVRMSLPTKMRGDDLARFDRVRDLLIVSQIEHSHHLLSEASSRVRNPELWERIDREFAEVARFGNRNITYIIRRRRNEHLSYD